MLSLSLSLAYLKLITFGGTISTVGGTITIPSEGRYISFHENNPLENPLEITSRQEVFFEIDEQIVVAVNTNTIQFSNFNPSSSLLYFSLWTAQSGGELIAYTEVDIPTTFIYNGVLIINPQMFVFAPTMR